MRVTIDIEPNVFAELLHCFWTIGTVAFGTPNGWDVKPLKSNKGTQPSPVG